MLQTRCYDLPYGRVSATLLSLTLAAAGCASAPGGAADETLDDTAADEGVVSTSGDVFAPDGSSRDTPSRGEEIPADTTQSDVSLRSAGETTEGDAGVHLEPDASQAVTWLIGGFVAGVGPQTLVLSGGMISEVLSPDDSPPTGVKIIDVEGSWLAPAFIDSHVHIVYLPVAETLVAGGVAGVVDHAAPLSFFQETFGDLRVLGSGPMITATGGYPTQSWGANGYGIECAGTEEAIAAVDSLHDQGAAFIKVPFAGGPQLTADTVTAVISRAHELSMKVSVHALSEQSASLAAVAGADILAHTPTESLTGPTLDLWGQRAVVSTLSAFGGSGEAVNNLEALHQRGATVLYGTDLGNTSTAAIQSAELALLMSAGLTGAEILVAGTSAPAAWWGFEDLGALSQGKAANILVLSADPLVDPMTLSEPAQVLVNGEPLTP